MLNRMYLIMKQRLLNGARALFLSQFRQSLQDSKKIGLLLWFTTLFISNSRGKKLLIFGRKEGIWNSLSTSKQVEASRDFIVAREPRLFDSGQKSLWSKMNIAICFPFLMEGSKIENDSLYCFKQSLNELGVKTFTFDFSRTTLNSREHLLKLVSEINSTQPSAVIFAGNHWPSHKTESTFVELLSSLRKQNVKILAVAHDPWASRYQLAFSNWHKHGAKILYMDSPSLIESRVPLESLKFALFPMGKSVNDRYQGEHDPSELVVGFTGSIGFGVRPAWLYKILKLKEEFQSLRFVLNIHDRQTNIVSDSYIEYLDFYNRVDAIINLTEKPENASIVTNRALETISRGKFLIQEYGDSDPLSMFFVPSTHYYRFSNVSELYSILNLLNKDYDFSRGIAREAKNFWSSKYSARLQWEAILEI